MANNKPKKPAAKNAISKIKKKGVTANSIAKRYFGEPKPVPLPANFQYDDDSADYDAYAGVLQPIPPPRAGAQMVMKLEDVIGTDAVQKILDSGKIVFHVVGDTGADKRYRVVDEDDVAAMMVKDMNNSSEIERPAFFFHLGDIVYEFGEAAGYYPQFYEPFCMYNAPVFAIPGNHDGMIYDPKMASLQAFLANFCTPDPVTAPNAGGLLRSTMTQPGVYFTLDAPFVSVIGLYSNVADKGPGAISSENGKKPIIGDAQKAFLISELKRLTKLKSVDGRAVVLALHHPPFSGEYMKSGSKTLMNDLDDAFNKGGLWPDAILSGHSHLYQRFSRPVNGINIPYIVAGCGGYNLSPYTAPGNADLPKKPTPKPTDTTLQAFINAFGYLKIKATKGKLAIIFNAIDTKIGAAADSIVIDLITHKVTNGKKGIDPL